LNLAGGKKINAKTLAQFIERRFVSPLKMSLPPKPLPTLTAPHKALVVRSFKNASPFPVLKQLALETGWQVLFASWNPHLANSVAKIGVPFVQLKDFYRKKYTKIKNEHAAAVERTLAQVDTRLPAKILGDSLGMKAHYDARSALGEIVTQTRIYTDIYFDLIENIKPDVVVLLNEISLPERLTGLVSAITGTPSVSIQHGLYIGYVYRKLATDKVIVWGDEPKKFWEKTGCQPERIVSVGALAHEKWAAWKEKDSSAPPAIKPHVLFLGQNPAAFISQETHRKTINAVFHATQTLPQYHFIVKPHPGEDIKPYKTALQELQSQSNVELVTSSVVENAIRQSDLVITVFSTAGLEAMLMGKPVIVLNLSEESSIAPYAAAAELVESKESLSRSIQTILEDPVRRQFLISAGNKYADEYFGKMDGQAAQRAVQVIQEIARPQSP
jgi:hypothetical protein